MRPKPIWSAGSLLPPLTCGLVVVSGRTPHFFKGWVSTFSPVHPVRSRYSVTPAYRLFPRCTKPTRGIDSVHAFGFSPVVVADEG